MSEKHIVVHGGTVKCQFSVEPKTDKLQVLTQTKDYANDKDGENKLIATDKEIGQTLEKNSFGKCKMQPNGSGDFLPCMATILKWSKPYEKLTMSNKGKALTEESKATCPIGGADCISIDKHGQKTEAGKQNIKNANQETHNQTNPLVNIKELAQKKSTSEGLEQAKN